MCLTHHIPLFNVVCFWLAIIFTSCVVVFTDGEKCTECQFLVATFKEGMNRTSKSHFGGGNTAWEERKLGKFLTSEIRFAEVMEYICKKEVLKEFYDYNGKELQFKCHNLAEDAEELLEKWFFELQTTKLDLEAHLCINELKRCCPAGHFGLNCNVCPGFFAPAADSAEEPRVCFGHGRCHGSGTREGSGRCDCDSGYVGKTCSNCAAHYFLAAQTPTSVECEGCFDGCASGCSSAGPKGCNACRTGYVMDETEGCQDVDECTTATDDAELKCTKENERCVNTPGSYRCDCEYGYRRSGDVCELDVEESSNSDEDTVDDEIDNDFNRDGDFTAPQDIGEERVDSPSPAADPIDDVVGENVDISLIANEQVVPDGAEEYSPPPADALPTFKPYDGYVVQSTDEWLVEKRKEAEDDDEWTNCSNDDDSGQCSIDGPLPTAANSVEPDVNESA